MGSHATRCQSFGRVKSLHQLDYYTKNGCSVEIVLCIWKKAMAKKYAIAFTCIYFLNPNL